MVAATVPAIYASALLELAEERAETEAVVADCRELHAVLAEDPRLLAGLTSPGLGDHAKDLIDETIGGKLGKTVVDLCKLLVDRGRLGEVRPILAEIVREAERRAGRIRVGVRSAVELSAENRSRLDAQLKERFGDGIEIVAEVEPDLLGGLTIRVDDLLVDGSVRRHLDKMKQQILEVSADERLWEGVDETMRRFAE